MHTVFMENFIERSRARISHKWDHINVDTGGLNVGVRGRQKCLRTGTLCIHISGDVAAHDLCLLPQEICSF